MNQAIIQELISDILKIDPELKTIKPKIEKLVQELISNKPEAPFTKDFKDSLKAQIIGAINEQKALNEGKNRNRNSLFHGLKFWMIGASSITAGLIVFAIFQYLGEIQQPETQITYMQKTNLGIKQNLQEDALEERQTFEEPIITEKPQTNNETTETSDNDIISIFDYQTEVREETAPAFAGTSESQIMAKSAIIADTNLSASQSPTAGYAPETSPTFCETSKTFLETNNISESTQKTFYYNNQVYKATIDFRNNKITINHIGTQNDSIIQTETPNLDKFLQNNNFNLYKDYNSAVIEESDSFIEYYFPKLNQQEGIAARIDKTSNIIYTISNICIY